MNTTFIRHLQNTSKRQIWIASVILASILTLLITSGMDLLLNGKVTSDFLITGLVASIAVASIVSGLIIYFLQSLAQIHQDSQHLDAILRAHPIPMALNDDAHNILMINLVFTKTFGYTLEDIPTLEHWWPKAYPDLNYRQWVADHWQERVQRMKSAGTDFEPFEVRIQCKDGSIRHVMASATPLDVSYQGMHLVVLYDVTERVAATEALAESRNILQSVIETIPMRIFWKDRGSRYLGCNTAFAMDGGASQPADIIGKMDSQLSWKDQAALYQADDYQVIQSGVSKLSYDEPQSTPDGKLIWLRTSKVPLQDSKANVIGVLGVYEDISERKKVENELWLTKRIIDKSRTAFFRLSPEGTVQYVNDFSCESLGYSREELIGMHPWDFDPDFPAEAWPGVWQRLLKNEIVNIETRHRRKDGSIFNVDVTGHYIFCNGEEFSFVFVQDTTERKKTETALRQKEGYQRALLDNFPFMVWLKDTDSRFLATNQVLAEALGEANPEKLVGKSDFDYSPPHMAESYQRDDRAVLASGQRKIVEEEHVDHLGVHRWLETFKAPVIDKNGEKLGTVGFARDISDRKRIEADLRIAATAFESQEGMIITDANTIILKINQSFTRITGFTAEDAVGHKMNLLKSGVHDASFYIEMWESIKRTGFWQGEIWNRRKNGDIYPEWLTITAVKDDDGVVTHYVGTMIDITTRKAIEERVHHLAHYDVLTDLPNRSLLADRLHQALAQVRREKAMLALLFLDLDKFKPVNDMYGHDVGDLLLREVGYRLQKCVKRESDTVARIGGDEFVILLSPIEEQADAAVVAEKILQALNQTFEIEQYNLDISTSIGIAIYPTSGQDVNTLLKNADNAMYEAKAAGRSCFRFYSE